MSFSKAMWQYRGLGLPAGVGLTRPLSRKDASTTQPSTEMVGVLVGDGLATALAPSLRRALDESAGKLVGPVVSKPALPSAPSWIVFAFSAAPAGAPREGWQMPIVAAHRAPSTRLLWLDVAPEALLESSALRSSAAKAGVEVVRPSEKVLRRAPNGVISAVGIAGLAGIVAAWTTPPAKHGKK